MRTGFKYGCPLCTQQSNRFYNMKVHIERWHDGIGIPVNNYLTKSSTLNGQNIAFNNNASKSYYNTNLRRFLPFNASRIQRPKYEFHSSDRDPFFNSFEIWERAVNTVEKYHNLFSRFSSARSYTYNPFASEYAGLAQPLYKLQDRVTRGDWNSSPTNYRPKGIDYEQVLGFHVDACSKCLEIHSIPVYKENHMDLEEQIKKMGDSMIPCRPQGLSRVMNLSLSQKKTVYIKL